MNVTLYELLQIEPTASREEIDLAFARFVQRYSWALAGEGGRLVRAAHSLLSRPEARRVYDRALAGER